MVFVLQVVVRPHGVPEHIAVGDGHHGLQPRHHTASRWVNALLVSSCSDATPTSTWRYTDVALTLHWCVCISQVQSSRSWWNCVSRRPDRSVRGSRPSKITTSRRNSRKTTGSQTTITSKTKPPFITKNKYHETDKLYLNIKNNYNNCVMKW